ncbi:hypothetical protein PCASD_21539 [Puccinia coronata f. sp. avenae]|uniref:Uncharacterized protein n=1 Tax=Puccinia coronata f. sp. avenae TaxID=200324 RepID=A0A2N5TTE3_9BASI|nr:hypothetical protein PCASD_21539 [Puccinia coronata f. sp. avenae]
MDQTTRPKPRSTALGGGGSLAAKLAKVAAKGGIGPPPPSLAACTVAALLEAKYTSRPAKVRSRSRDGSSTCHKERIVSGK